MSTRKLLVMLFLLTIASESKPQEYAPVGAKWTYSWEDDIFPYPQHPYFLQVIRKDTIKGKEVSIIKDQTDELRKYWQDGSGELAVYEEEKKVWYYSPFNQRFNLLYDFNAKLGDTIEITGLSEDSITGRAIMRIESISFDTACETSKKLWTVRNLPIGDPGHIYWDFLEEIVEGVGSTYFILPTFSLIHPFSVGLRCYEDENTDCKWLKNCDEKIVRTNITGEEEELIKISPNPTTGKINIESKELVQKVELYNINGKRISVIESNKFELPKDLGKMYIIVIEMKSGERILKRIVKN